MAVEDEIRENRERRDQGMTTRAARREFCRSVLSAGATAMSSASAFALQSVASRNAQAMARAIVSTKWKIGHHFWNWDRAWDNAEFLNKRLRLTKEAGYDGFEAKPHEIGAPAGALRERCEQFGVQCAAIGGALKEGIDYAHAAGAKIVRAGVPKDESRRWVDYAGQRGIILVVHPHLARPGRTDAVETREDLLRYLDERPGVFACPDTGHLALCGSDPVRTIRDLGERCRYIHLKDIHPEAVGKRRESEKRFCELGAGALDLQGVLQALEDIGYRGWIMVERDSREPDYIQSARRMRAALRRLGY
jgi:sugar phosphate isomerase/epimerase